jgi:hypothetical protein
MDTVKHQSNLYKEAGFKMKYRVSYLCRVDGKIYEAEFEIESSSVPSITENSVIEQARKDSIRYYKSGSAGIEIVSINPLS